MRSRISNVDVEDGYREMARDDARETEAREWVEAAVGDAYDAAR